MAHTFNTNMYWIPETSGMGRAVWNRTANRSKESNHRTGRVNGNGSSRASGVEVRDKVLDASARTGAG